jgi:hypothetical protein
MMRKRWYVPMMVIAGMAWAGYVVMCVLTLVF